MKKVIHNFRGLLAEPNAVIGFRGRKLLRFSAPFNRAEELGRLPLTWVSRIAKLGLMRRLLRYEIYHMLRTNKGTYLCAGREGILRLPKGDDMFTLASSDFQGKRPICLCQDGEGNVYFGEYFSNPDRKPVHVWCSRDDGKTWQVCYEYPAGSIRHIHGIRWDAGHERLWVFTGDHGDESHIAVARPGFQDYTVLAQEGQMTRTCAGVLLGDQFIYGTDTPFEQNYACSVDRVTGDVVRHQVLPNSVFFMTKALGGILLSTVAEPSHVNNNRSSEVWYSSDGVQWESIKQFTPDGWHRIWFQLPAIFLGEGDSEGKYAYLSCRAVKGYDNDCLVVSQAT